MSRVTPLRWLLLPPLFLASLAARASVDSSLVALNQGRADDAVRLLRTQLAANPHDAYAHQLLCRVFYSVEMAEAAIAECQAAATDAPASRSESSQAQMWLGRAYGMKAAAANPVTAFRLARKVVAAFEQAVALDPRNVAALSDLGEYYVAAPAMVGGGLAKARRLAADVMPVSPTKAHRILAMAAEKASDFATAEAEFRRAVEAQPSPASWVDLAAFYQRQHSNDACVAAVQMAIRLDRARDASLVDAASILNDADRSPELVRQLLPMYLASPARSDAAPAVRVHLQLGNLLLKSGDEAGARREYEAALNLAVNYAPAKQALKALAQAPPAKALPSPGT